MPGGFRSFTNDIHNKHNKPGLMPTYDNFKSTYKSKNASISLNQDPFEKDLGATMPFSVQNQKEKQ